MLKITAAAVPRKLLRGLALRIGWGVADQGMSSLTNFAVTIYVARWLSLAQLGAFSLAYVTYSFALNASRGLATDPLMVRFSGADVPQWRRAVAMSTGTAAVVGTVSAVVVLAASAFMHGTTRSAFLALGLTLPGLLLQDSWRYAFFAIGRGSQALLNDTIWAVGLVVALIVLNKTGHTSVFWYELGWGAAAALGAAIGPIQARVFPDPTKVRGWISRHRDLAPRYLAENTTNAGASQLRSYGIGLIVSLAALGAVQAASTLMGPFLVVFMGMSLVTIPEASRVLRRSPRRLQLFCLLVGGGLAVGAALWGTFLLIALPRGLGELVLRHNWVSAYGLVLPLTGSIVGACFIAGATTGLRALGAARRSLRAMVVSAVIFLAFGLAGAAWNGALGAMQGAAIATFTGSAVWWWQLHGAVRDSGISQARRGARRPTGRHGGLRAADAASSARRDKPTDSGTTRQTFARFRHRESEGT